MIPSVFGEKDVDFEVFSTDETRVSSIIEGVLRSRSDWSAISLLATDFGYQLPQEAMQERGFRHYVDFWLWSEGEDDDDGRIRCVGRRVAKHEWGGESGCDRWFRTFTGKPPPTFERGDHFPPVHQVRRKRVWVPDAFCGCERASVGRVPCQCRFGYARRITQRPTLRKLRQVFGTHRVPIPRTSAELETFEYAGHVEHWNATCGNHRRWSDEKGTWLRVPREGRECARFYSDQPFVFARGDGKEELRQGDVVLHRTEAPAP